MNELPIKIELPQDFLKEETRCDYLVTASIKELWAVELDLLSELLRVCKKYDIKIYADGGTMLGAVRHKGFIPWDDDIDLMLLRSEYERLCEVAPKEFQYPYFWQTEETDPGSARGHAQLRNSLTTCILKSESHLNLKFNQGVFIDIFPFDNIPDDVIQRKAFMRHMNDMLWKYRTELYYSRRIDLRKNLYILLKNVYFYLSKHSVKSYKLFYKEATKYDAIETTHAASCPFFIERYIINKSDLENFSYMPFEFMEIPVASGYERILNDFFGNWHEFVKGTSNHGGLIYDVRVPYTEFLKNRK